MNNKVGVFEQNVQEYDQWFDEHQVWFESELKALKKAMPGNKDKYGLEIGIGTGRFAEALSIDCGIEPSKKMAKMAETRGIPTRIGKAENMPFKNNTFYYTVMITVDCFLEDIPKALQETARILKPKGELIIGMIDRDSPLGQQYMQNKEDNLFYRHARFHSVEEITEYLKAAGFGSFEYWQTLITANETTSEVPEQGYGEGGFAVIKAMLKE